MAVSLSNATISNYRILEQLGIGGMGRVYLAEDTALRRKAVLKFLLPEYSSIFELKVRFMREARAAAALSHPNVVTIYEVGEFDHQPYFAMEYVEGGALRALLATKELSISAMIDIGTQVCAGLSEAHRAGIVHRDLKPENILLKRDNWVKIADFGLALLRGATPLTLQGAKMGTPLYMSPEQVRRETLDQRSDIFSLGIILYELITRRLPFASEYAILHEEPKPLARYQADVSEGLQRIINKALDKDVETRYQHVEDLLADLKREKKLRADAEPSTRSMPLKGVPLTREAPKLKREELKPSPVAPQPAGARWSPRFALFGVGALLFVMLVVYLLLSRQQEAVPSFSITTAPANATVYLNGNAIGNTPLKSYRAKAGSVALRIQKPNYFPRDTTIVLAKGRDATFSFILKPATARVTIQVVPPDAEVILDGERFAASKLTRRTLAIGTHTLNLSREDYQSVQTQFRVAQRDTTLLFYLKSIVKTEYGIIELRSYLTGKVYIDGNWVGNIENGDAKEYNQEVGAHKIEVRGATGTVAQTVTVAKGKTAPVTLRLLKSEPKVEYGMIQLLSYLAGKVYLDGNEMGNIASGEEREYDQVIGSHKIEVLSGNETLSRNITVSKGKTVQVTLRPQQVPPEVPRPSENKLAVSISAPRYPLRHEARENLSGADVKAMLRQNNFYARDSGWNKDYSNPLGQGMPNDFELQQDGKVVFDRATGLMWQQGGSGFIFGGTMTYEGAKDYVAQLNRDNFAGYNDWRLPTLEEAMSLVEPVDLHIDSKFDSSQSWIWTADICRAGVAWVVHFDFGFCALVSVGDITHSVRAVRVGQ